MMEVLQRRLWPDDAWFGVAASTTSHLPVMCCGCHIAFRVWKWPINVGTDSIEGHGIKVMPSFSMMEVLQRRFWPDDARFGVAASTISYLLVVCDGCNVAFREWKWPINVGKDSTERHCIKAMPSFSMASVLQPRLRPDETWFGMAASITSTVLIIYFCCNSQPLSLWVEANSYMRKFVPYILLDAIQNRILIDHTWVLSHVSHLVQTRKVMMLFPTCLHLNLALFVTSKHQYNRIVSISS